MFDKTLYKMHSTGQVGSWRIYVTEGIVPTMVREARKVISGKAVETPLEFTEGKNIGRSNETTPLEQALSEAESKYKKQLDKGYVTEIPKEGSAVTNALGFAKPMLATAMEKVKNWTYPVFVQPKFDGHRMLATVQKGEVVLYSRQGKVVDVEHVRAELQKAFNKHLAGGGGWDGRTLDGEIYKHGETLQKISSLVKKPKPESAELIYQIYDVIDSELCYPDRDIYIAGITNDFDNSIIRPVETHLVHKTTDIGFQSIDDLHAKFIGEGYEGSIVRWGDFGYEDDKRSKSLMKNKDFQDAEFKVIGSKEGRPYVRPNKTYRVPIWRCVTSDGKEFDVTAAGNMQEKHEQFQNRKGFEGALLTVKFFNYTPDGIPFHGVALRWREDI